MNPAAAFGLVLFSFLVQPWAACDSGTAQPTGKMKLLSQNYDGGRRLQTD